MQPFVTYTYTAHLNVCSRMSKNVINYHLKRLNPKKAQDVSKSQNISHRAMRYKNLIPTLSCNTNINNKRSEFATSIQISIYLLTWESLIWEWLTKMAFPIIATLILPITSTKGGGFYVEFFLKCAFPME